MRSRLCAIIDNLAEIEKWRATVPKNQRTKWAHPDTVWKHCPFFHKDKATKPKGKSPMAKLHDRNVALQEENEAMKRRLEADDGRNQITPTSKPDDVARVATDGRTAASCYQIACAISKIGKAKEKAEAEAKAHKATAPAKQSADKDELMREGLAQLGRDLSGIFRRD